MATTQAQTLDLAQVLADLLGGIEDLRPYWLVSDTVRPPAVVIGQPSIDFQDSSSGFCSATWTFPLTIVVSRNSDREAQQAMSRLLGDITTALGEDVPGVLSIEPVDARPIPVTVSGVELPGYLLNVRVRA